MGIKVNCHPELVAKQGELESRSFMPLSGVSGSVHFEIKAFSCLLDRC